MEAYVIVYRRDGTALSQLPLLPIVQESLQQILGRSLAELLIDLKVYPVPLASQWVSTPIMVNLSANYGYAEVRVLEKKGTVIYQHPHTIEELIAQTLQKTLKHTYPNETHWGYYLMMPGIAPPPPKVHPLDHLSTSRLTPAVEGSVIVTPYGPNERPAFELKRIPEPPLPKASLEDFHLISSGGDRQAFVKVLVHEPVFNDFDHQRTFSNQVEEGGFLVGRVYEDRDVIGTYWVEVTSAVKAEHTGASLFHFTYTGDSFAAFKRILREQYPEQRLLGWYHTHLFPATPAMGLSSIDLQSHFTTFRLDWQLAALINLDSPSQRTLRFYVRQSNIMMLCPQWIVQS